MSRPLHLLAVAAFVALGACSGDEPPVGSPTTPATAAPTTSPALPSDEPCATVPAEAPDRLGVELCRVGGSGLTVTLRVRATDGDATVRSDCASPVAAWGDDRPARTCRIGCVPGGERRASAVERPLSHDYATAGTYRVTVTVESGCGEPPNGERRDVALDVRAG